MAEKIKDLAKHSEDAINLVWSELNEEERGAVSTVLGKMTQRLGKKEKKVPKEKNQMTTGALLRLYIIPQIQRSLNDYEVGELSCEPELKTAFNFRMEWNDSVNETTEHENIISAETSVKTLGLITQFCRGKFYIYIAEKIKREAKKSVKQSLEEGRLNVSYRTFLRYIAFANDVIRFPRLLVVNLSFSQILKYRRQLTNYFTSAEGLALGAQISKCVANM